MSEVTMKSTKQQIFDAYQEAMNKIKELIDNGEIGRLISIDHLENVGYWHQAHSFVRGNWRNSIETSPMILAKCCHDLDLISWFANSKCKSLTSYGALNFFKEMRQFLEPVGKNA